jgi:hypothetical protein
MSEHQFKAPPTWRTILSGNFGMSTVTAHRVRPRLGRSLPPLGKPLDSVGKRDPGPMTSRTEEPVQRHGRECVTATPGSTWSHRHWGIQDDNVITRATLPDSGQTSAASIRAHRWFGMPIVKSIWGRGSSPLIGATLFRTLPTSKSPTARDTVGGAFARIYSETDLPHFSSLGLADEFAGSLRGRSVWSMQTS